MYMFKLCSIIRIKMLYKNSLKLLLKEFQLMVFILAELTYQSIPKIKKLWIRMVQSIKNEISFLLFIYSLAHVFAERFLTSLSLTIYPLFICLLSSILVVCNFEPFLPHLKEILIIRRELMLVKCMQSRKVIMMSLSCDYSQGLLSSNTKISQRLLGVLGQIAKV